MTRVLVILALAAVPAWAQLRAELAEKSEVNGSWVLLLRDRNYRVYRCTAVPSLADFTQLKVGDVVEWTPSNDPGDCQIAALRFVGRPTDNSPTNSPGRLRLELNPLNSIIRRGTLSYGGSVTRLDRDRLELRTRAGQRLEIFLRDDTHFFANGLLSKPADLSLNQVISVRAGKTWEGRLEAFFVMWGQIIQPGPVPEIH